MSLALLQRHRITAVCLLSLALMGSRLPTWAADVSSSPNQYVPLSQQAADQTLQDLKARLNLPNLKPGDLIPNSEVAHGVNIDPDHPVSNLVHVDPIPVPQPIKARIPRPIRVEPGPAFIHPSPGMGETNSTLPLEVNQVDKQIALVNNHIVHLEEILVNMRHEYKTAVAQKHTLQAKDLKVKIAAVRDVVLQLNDRKPVLEKQSRALHAQTNIASHRHHRPRIGIRPRLKPPVLSSPVSQDPFQTLDPQSDPTLTHGRMNLQ